ncbi:MAG TPA: PA2169 family four-helix-bundle protein [Mucilaginibacter sp.]|nr:PA2169 family four-helix-bundle protein [Mucilaginibacter sp.]
MENTSKTIEILGDLILINNDRIEGYERALKEVEQNPDDADLIPMFLRFIDDSRRYKVELGTEIAALGSEVNTGSTVPGRLHRAWMSVKEAFTGHDRHSILEECEFGEDAIKKAYREALNEEILAAYIRETLTEQQEELMEAHDEIKELRDSVHK